MVLLLQHILFNHLFGWVNLATSFVCQIAKVMISDELFFINIQVFETCKLILQRNFNLKGLKPFGEFVEGNLVFEVYVEEAKSCT